MNRLFTLLLAMAVTNCLLAQSIYKQAHTSRHNQMVNALLQMQQYHKVAAKPTATTKYRLKARSIRDNTFNALIDSVDLGYTGFRGSTYDYNTMLFPFNYPYSTSPMWNFGGTFTKPQVLFDTLRRWQVNPNTLVYGYYQTDLATYDTGNKLTNYKALYVDSAFYPNTIHKNTFTTAKNISMGISSNWIGGVADSAFKQYFTYDTGNRLTKDSTYELHLGAWRIVSKTFYTYDASKNLTVIENWANTTDTSFLLPLVRQLKYVNTYDASKRLLTVNDSFYNGTSALEAYMKDTFTYTGTFTFHTTWKQHQFDPIDGTWNPQFNMSKHLNSINLPDTVTIRGWDSILSSWVPSTMYVVSYNSNNDPDVLKDYQYNFTSFPATPDFTTKYYYQTFIDNTGVEELPAADNAKVFPNPATNTINITGLNVAQNSVVTYSLVNVSGQVMYNECSPWHGETQINVERFTPGIYWLVIHNDAGQIICRQSVIKP
ncbi:MAG: Secretion system C-terminal sorting domain [Flavipsychrobacter sp.]|nr:Secretion system C-terminal sorting domain [Flavipsychrobacter sp.]